MFNVFSKAGRAQIYKSYPYNVVMESIWKIVAAVCGTAFLAPVLAACKSGSLLKTVHATLAQTCVALFGLLLFTVLGAVALDLQRFFREKRRLLAP